MASPELGTKQICPNCQTKFYDLNRRPAHCPKCGTDFDPEDALRSRRTRSRVSPADMADDEPKATPVHDEADDQDDEEEEEATPEIDQAADEPGVGGGDEDAAEPGAAEPEFPADGEDEDEDEAADVPFLEEGDDDDLGEDDLEPLPDEGDEER